MIASLTILALWVIFMIIVFMSYCTNFSTIEFDDKWYTKELYNGVKECPQSKIIQDDQSEVYVVETNRVPSRIKLARLYTFLFLLRRLLIISIIIFMDKYEYGLKISSLLVLQTFYLIFVICIRVFNNVSDHQWIILLAYYVLFSFSNSSSQMDSDSWIYIHWHHFIKYYIFTDNKHCTDYHKSCEVYKQM